jgi:hypothetical protein
LKGIAWMLPQNRPRSISSHFTVQNHIVFPHSTRCRLHLCSSMGGSTRWQYPEPALQPLCGQPSPVSTFPFNSEGQITVKFVSYSVRYATTTVIGIVAGYGLDGGGSNPGREKRFFSRPTLGPMKPPVHWVRGFLLRGYNDRSVKLITWLHLSVEVKNGGATPPLPICLHGLALN